MKPDAPNNITFSRLGVACASTVVTVAIAVLLASSPSAVAYAEAKRGADAISSSSEVISHCASQPPCPLFKPTSWRTYSWGNVWRSVRDFGKCSKSHYDFTELDQQREVSERFRTLLSQVVGQDHVITPIKRELLAKLRNPSRPLVLLFTGDNGVGKTMTANLISLAMSLRCESERDCETGDTALSITATESNAEARASLVSRIAGHAYKHPYGVVIINEVLLMNPNTVEYLAPLFGRGKAFHDYPASPLNGLTVILTSDFGKHVAVTKGKTSGEIANMSKEAFAKRFGLTFTSEMRAHAFLPLSFESALLACRRYIHNLPCRNPQVTGVSISDESVVEVIVSKLVTTNALANNNAREITKYVQTLVDGLVSELFLGMPVGAQGSVALSLENDKTIRVVVNGPLGKSEDFAEL